MQKYGKVVSDLNNSPDSSEEGTVQFE